ncbi:MAG: RIP metalloprotease RseP [Rhodospirillales bacterium]|nr:RIP metalloprotease RseP [Rhodospirillales bacterium]
MSFLGFTWYYIILFLVVLTVLVYVHEWGHYWVARRNKVRVEVFSIGFGPEIWGWTDRSGTRWKISSIPLGGYVKMFGETSGPGAELVAMTPEEQAVSFQHKGLGQRAAIVAAGPIANLLFAIVIFACVAGFVGIPVPLAGVGHILPGSAAEAAGLKSGDTILAINGDPVHRFEDLRRVVSASPGVPLKLGVRRQGQEITVSATPEAKVDTDESGKEVQVGRLGIAPDPNQAMFERQNPAMAVWIGIERTFVMMANIVHYLGQLVTGAGSADQLGGPIRIAQMSGDMAQGGVVNLLIFIAALSVNLGLINLLPVPMLDGGHLVFYLAELVRGRPVGAKVQEYSFRFGLILVLLLMVYATWNDLKHLRIIEFIRGLVT